MNRRKVKEENEGMEIRWKTKTSPFYMDKEQKLKH